MNQSLRLYDIPPGGQGTVTALLTTGPMRRRLLDLGLIPQTSITCLGRAPQGDPTAYLIRGSVIAIRAEDAQHILIQHSETRR